MLRLVLFSLLFSCAATAELRLTAERPLSPTATAPAAGSKDVPAVASDGDGFLAAWIEERSGAPRLIGVRVSGNGEVLDPAGFVIDASAGMGQPSIAWNGSAYIVTSPHWPARYFAVTPAGAVTPLAAPPEVQWPRNEKGETIRISDGGNVWFVDAAGAQSIAVNLPEHLGTPRHVMPVGSDDWIVVFTTYSSVQWARLNRQQGLVRWRELLSDSSAHPFPQFTTAVTPGGQAAVVWTATKQMAETPTGLRLRYTFGWATVDPEGRVLSGKLPPQEIPYIFGMGGSPAFGPAAVTGDGTAFHAALTFSTEEQVSLLTLRIAGGAVREVAVEGPHRHTPDWPNYRPALASGSRNILVWRNDWYGPLDESRQQILFTTFARGGAADENPAAVLSTAAVKQEEPRAAGALTVWREAELASVIRARFGDGPVLEVSPRGFVQLPRVAFAGGAYAVAWFDADARRVMLRRFDGSGNPLDAAPLAIGDKDITRGLEIVARGEAFQLVSLAENGTVRTVTVPLTGNPGQVLQAAPATFDPRRSNLVVTSSGNAAAILWTETTTALGTPLTSWRLVRVTGNTTIGPQVELFRNSERGSRFGAALFPDRLLLAWPVGQDNGGCIATQPFTADGAYLRVATQIACDTGAVPAASMAVGGERLWLVIHGSDQPRLLEITRDGAPGQAFPLDPGVHVTHLTPLPAGLAILYTRSDMTAGAAQRAFVRLLADQDLRRRSVRH